MKQHTPIAVEPRARLKTYSHLGGDRRMPTEYEVATSHLLYYVERGFEAETPLAEFYRRHQTGSTFHCSDWESFRDPRQTTYTRYTTIMAQREAFVDRLLERIEETGSDERLSKGALTLYEELIAPLRYPMHGLQMAAAYVGQMAPGGRIVIPCALQAADEVRRIQRHAYRLAMLRRRDGELARTSRARWQGDALFQPLRDLVERLLVTFDWGEAFAALCLCLKPAFDELANGLLADALRRAGDSLFAEVLSSLDEDAAWHRAWSHALLEMAVRARPENGEVVRHHLAEWTPRALAAFAPLRARLDVDAMPRAEAK